MRKVLILFAISTLAFGFNSCRETQEKTIIKEVPAEEQTTKENDGVLERAGEKVDDKVNERIDDEIDKIDDN